MNILYLLAVAILLLLPLLAAFGMLRFFHWMNSRNVFPLKDKVPREAGWSTRIILQRTRDGLIVYLCIFPVALIMAGLLVAAEFHYQNQVIVLQSGYWIVSGVILIFLLFKILMLIRKTNVHAINLSAQVAVGQVLNQLMKLGYAVYHDLYFDSFRLDHLIVGAGGVFAITSIGHAKPNAKMNKQIRVLYQKGKLIFPDGMKTRSLEHATERANNVGVILKRIIKIPIDVKPVVVLPGWLIEQKARSTLPVLAPKQLNSYFRRVNNGLLDELDIEKINALIPSLNK